MELIPAVPQIHFIPFQDDHSPRVHGKVQHVSRSQSISKFHAHFVSIVHGLSSCVATATEGFPRAQLQFSTCSGGNQVRCSTLAFPRDQLQASPNPGTWVRRNDVTIIHPLELRSFVRPKRTRDLSQDRQSYSFHSVCVLSPHWGNALQQDH